MYNPSSADIQPEAVCVCLFIDSSFPVSGKIASVIPDFFIFSYAFNKRRFLSKLAYCDTANFKNNKISRTSIAKDVISLETRRTLPETATLIIPIKNISFIFFHRNIIAFFHRQSKQQQIHSFSFFFSLSLAIRDLIGLR